MYHERLIINTILPGTFVIRSITGEVCKDLLTTIRSLVVLSSLTSGLLYSVSAVKKILLKNMYVLQKYYS